MISISYLFEIDKKHIEKIEVSKNYIIQNLKNKPPKEDIETYRKKVVYDKDGNKHLLNLAILKNGKGTKLTSIWHDKKEGSAKSMLSKWKESDPDKVENI
ncbi:MAG: hypothetical protein WC188_03795 [Candidatus Caldatribacteriota bacterium]